MTNLIAGNANTFNTALGEWTIVNGASYRLLEVGPYSLDFIDGTLGNAMEVTPDGLGVTTATTESFAVTPSDTLIAKVLVSTTLYTALRNGYASMEVRWYSDQITLLSPYPGDSSFTDSDITNPSATTAPEWHGMSSLSPVPDGAAFGKLEVAFSSGTFESGTTVGDRFAIYDPTVLSFNASLGEFPTLIYGELPEFMRHDDVGETAVLNPLARLVSALTSSAGTISDTAETFEYAKPIDGIESKSALTDPDTMKSGGIPWLAALMGVTLTTANSAFAPWAALVDFDGGDAGSIVGQWDDWETLADWAAIEGFGVGFSDPTATYRDQLRVGFSGIHAGRADKIEEFTRTLLNSVDPDNELVIVKKRNRDTPFLLEVDIDVLTDPDPGTTTVQDTLDFGMPAGVISTTNSTATPVMHSSLTRLVLNDDFADAVGVVAGAGEYAAQGLANVEGGTATASLMNSSLNTDPLLGGHIGEAPFALGKALFSGLQVEASSATSASLDPVGDYDIIVGVSNVTTPTAPAGSGTENGSVDGRILAYGPNWSLHVTKLDELAFIHNGDSTGNDIVTSSTTYSFTAQTANKTVWIRVEKTSESVNFYIQDSLYEDWSLNQLGTTQALTAGNGAMVSAAGAAHVTALSSTTLSPVTDINNLPLSCVVHRIMLFTAAITTGAWAAEADGNYNYSADNAVTKLDINFNTDPVTNYDASFTATVGGTVTVTDNGGENTNQMHGMVQSVVSGDTFYFGKSPLQFDGGNPANSGDDLVALVANGTYDWKMTYVDITDDATPLTETVTSVAATGGTGITWDADNYGDRSIVQLEVVLTASGVFDSGNDEAMFLPSTIPPDGTTQEGVTTGADSATLGPVTWELDRAYHTGVDEEYLPSQVINRDFIHMQDGVITIEKVKPVDIHTPVTYVMVLRTFHTGGTDDILRHQDDNTNGVLVQFSGTDVVASITDGTNTLGPITWTAEADGRIGYWNVVAVRYCPICGLAININGIERASDTTPDLTDLLVGANDQIILGEAGDLKDFGLAGFAMFDRHLTDAELVKLNDEMNITPSGFAGQSFGSLGSSIGTAQPEGTAIQSFSDGSDAATGSGSNNEKGVLAGSFGSLGTTSAAKVVVVGLSTQSYGVVATATGLSHLGGTAAGSFGGGTNNGIGSIPQLGSADQSFSDESGTVVGTRQAEGVAIEAITFTGDADGGLTLGTADLNFNIVEAFGSAVGTVV